MEEIKKGARAHNFMLENRERLSLTGVDKVENFDDQSVVLQTPIGALTIRGENLHISNLNVDSGDLSVSGKIIGLVYSDKGVGKSGMLGRLFK